MAKTNQKPLNPGKTRDAAQRALDESESGYQRDILSGAGLRDALMRAYDEADPSIRKVREARAGAQTRLGNVFSDSMADLEGISDPYARERVRSARSTQYGTEADLLGGRLTDLSADRDSRISSGVENYNTMMTAKQSDVNSRREALLRAIDAANRSEDIELSQGNRLQDRKWSVKDAIQNRKWSKADMAKQRGWSVEDRDLARQWGLDDTAADRAFEGRMDDLTRQAMLAEIAATGRSNRGSGSGGNSAYTFEDTRQDPLGAFLQQGGERRPKADGGYDFFDKDGNPITAEQAAATVPGASVAAFLEDSTNQQDIDKFGQKATNDAQAEFQTDLTNAIAAIARKQNRWKPEDARSQLYAKYPQYRAVIDSAIPD